MKKIFIGSAHHIFFAAILLLPISGVCKDSSEPDRYSTPGKTPSVYSAGIFGDANGDDVIDPRDKEYIQEIISKRKVPTRLSDANGDGKIDIQDVEQVELLIKEKQKEIVIIDSTYRVVKIDKPINRIIVLSSGTPAGALRALGGANFMKKIVGINGMMSKDPFFKELHDRPSVGWPTPDYEAIVALKPDLVIASANPAFAFDIVEKMKPFGILVLCLDFQGKPEQSLKELKMIGVVMKRTERATEYVRFCKSSLDMVKDRLSRLDPEKRKKVYCEFIQDYEVLARSDGIIQGAGGSHLFEALFLEDYMEQKRFIVDPEEIIRKNPDVIIKDPHVGVMWSGYAKGVVARMERVRSDLIKRPGGEKIKAIQNGEVYVTVRELGNERMLSTLFLAKALYPDLFADVDAGKVLKQWLEEFHGKRYENYQIALYHPTKPYR